MSLIPGSCISLKDQNVSKSTCYYRNVDIPSTGRGDREDNLYLGCRAVPVTDNGVLLPDLSGDASNLILEDASTSPTAFSFDDPTAGAAL